MPSTVAARDIGISVITLRARVLAGAIRGRWIAGRLHLERAEIVRVAPIEAERKRQRAERGAERRARRRAAQARRGAGRAAAATRAQSPRGEGA